MHNLKKVLSRLVSGRSDESVYEILPSSTERPKTPPPIGNLPSFGDVSALQPLGVAPHSTRRDWLHIDSMGNPTYLQVRPSTVSSTKALPLASPRCSYTLANFLLLKHMREIATHFAFFYSVLGARCPGPTYTSYHEASRTCGRRQHTYNLTAQHTSLPHETYVHSGRQTSPGCRARHQLQRRPDIGPSGKPQHLGAALFFQTCCLSTHTPCSAHQTTHPESSFCRSQVPTPSPSTVFIRDKAILVNLESLRMIVCSDKVSFAGRRAEGPAGAFSRAAWQLRWLSFCGFHGSCTGHAQWLMPACCAQVFLLSAPVQGQPLTHGTFPAVENFFVRDLCIRLKPERSPRSGRATPVATDRNLP